MQFSEVPLYILKNFFQIFELEDTPDSSIMGNVLVGSPKWENFELAVKTSDRFERVSFTVAEEFDDKDHQIKLSYVSGNIDGIESGDDVYFRKGSELYQYVNSHSFEYYVNVNKDFLYLGKIYFRGGTNFFVYVDSLFHLMVRALPENNRTEKLVEFLNLCFNNIYSDVYLKQKDIKTLIDPKEIDINYLEYLAKTFNIDVDTDFLKKNPDITRTFIENIPNFLKRKGTYDSIFIGLNIIFANTDNILKVYERWHPEFDWNADPNPLPHFVDFEYLNFYSMETSGSVDGEYVLSETDNYPWQSPKPLNSDLLIHKQWINSTKWVIYHNLNTDSLISQVYDANYKRISPCNIIYSNDKIEIQFDTATDGYVFIAKSDTSEILPSVTSVWDFDHNLNNFYPLSEYTDSNGYTVDPEKMLYNDENTIKVYPSYEEDGKGVAVESDYTYNQTELSSTWDFSIDNETVNAVIVQFLLVVPRKEFYIHHNLSNKNIIVQCYDYVDMKMVEPISLSIVNENKIFLSFFAEFQGFVVIAESESTYTQTIPSSAWDITHNEREFALTQFYKSNYTRLIESSTIPISSGYLESTFSLPTSGYVQLVDYDYIENVQQKSDTWIVNHELDNSYVLTQVFALKPSDNWTVNHNIGSNSVIVQCYTFDNELLYPSNITIQDEDTVSIEWSEEVTGYTLIAASTSTHSISPSAIQEIEHEYDDYPIQQTYEDDQFFIPYITEHEEDKVVYLFSENVSGSTNMVESDWIHYQNDASDYWLVSHHLQDRNIITQYFTKTLQDNGTEWTLNHNYGTVLSDVYDSNMYLISPYDISTYTKSSSAYDYDTLVVDYDGMYVDGYIVISSSDETFTQPTTAYEWTINHSLNSDIILTQIYDDNNNKLNVDYTEIVDTSTIMVSSAEPISGYALLKEANFKTDALSGSEWNIQHNLNKDGVILQCYDNNDIRIQPSDVLIVDDNNLTITFGDSATEGYAIILAENMPVRQVFPDTVTILNEDLIEARFNREEEGYALVKFANRYNTVEKVYPKEIKIVDENNVEIEFFEEAKGYAVVKKSDFNGMNLELSDPSSVTISKNNVLADFGNQETVGISLVKYVGAVSGPLIMSPHYKVEFDLSSEPYGDSYIINKDYSNMITNIWESTRPACKYAHYQYKLQPETDFTGNSYMLYGNDYKSECSSYMTVTPYTSGGDSFVQTYVYSQQNQLQEWVIDHNLNSYGVLIQTFDNTDVKINPSEVETIDSNTIKVSFEQKETGYSLVTKYDDKFMQTQMPSSDTWTFTHALSGGNEAIIQVYSQIDTLIYPDVLISESSDQINIQFDQRTKGYALMGENVKITQSLPYKTWNINHNLGVNGVIAQFFDTSGNMIEPDSYQLVDKNNCKATFDQKTNGFVLLKTVNSKYTKDYIIYNINNNGYIKVGDGEDLDSFYPTITNDIKSPLKDSNGDEYKLDINFEEFDKYITIDSDFEEEISNNITEVGVFDQFDNIIFYSFFDKIYKTKDFDFRYKLKVNK